VVNKDRSKKRNISLQFGEGKEIKTGGKINFTEKRVMGGRKPHSWLTEKKGPQSRQHTL